MGKIIFKFELKFCNLYNVLDLCSVMYFLGKYSIWIIRLCNAYNRIAMAIYDLFLRQQVCSWLPEFLHPPTAEHMAILFKIDQK